MSVKPVFSFKNTTGDDVISPFWAKAPTKVNRARQGVKLFWKWFKLALFAFLMIMGLWGCFQSMWDGTVAVDPHVGGGLEFGFPFGTTGDWRYDLTANQSSQYHTFSNWDMSYGPFYGIFVFPGAWLVLNLMYATSNWVGGLNALMSIFVLLTIIRILTGAATLRSSLQNEKMSEVQGKMAEINAKYKDLKDPASKQKKQQETMQLYRKYKIKPFAAFEQMFITLPIFLIIYRVVTIARPLKATTLFGMWNFATTPLTALFSSFTSGGWVYIFFLLIVVPAQYASMKLPQIWARQRNRDASATSGKGEKQQKKTRMIQNVFAIAMGAIVAFSAAGVGVYWFLNSLFSVAQSYIIHRIILHRRKSGGSKTASRLAALGIT